MVRLRRERSGALGPEAANVFLFLNVIGVAGVTYLAMRAFLLANHRLAVERARLREVERAYLSQEVMIRQQDRLATFGRLSAGVAHELNNPAAAAMRASGHLAEVVDRLIEDAVGLLQTSVGAEGLAWFASGASVAERPDPLEMSDREERLARWLTSRSVPDAWSLAADLAELGIDVGLLDGATERYRERQVVAAARWIADTSRARRLLDEVRMSNERITGIVGALKGYSHMDGAALTEVDVNAGIEDTLVILRSRLSGVTVRRELEPGLPLVAGNPGELNQVWTNLLDNAAGALDGGGAVTIRTSATDESVRVEVEDDGPGIPADLLDRVFDPFVTTKPPGEGTGLGLHLARQIVVDRHGGSISAESSTGRTLFTVLLPVEGGGSLRPT